LHQGGSGTFVLEIAERLYGHGSHKSIAVTQAVHDSVERAWHCQRTKGIHSTGANARIFIPQGINESVGSGLIADFSKSKGRILAHNGFSVAQGIEQRQHGLPVAKTP
jgi:hypothetical protein